MSDYERFKKKLSAMDVDELRRQRAIAPLTDEELAIALAFYTETTRNLEVLGPAFRLACNETRRRQYELEGYAQHRGLGVDVDLLTGPTTYSTTSIGLSALGGKA